MEKYKVRFRGKRRVVELENLTDKVPMETCRRNFLGIAIGKNLCHCLFLGAKHKPRFLEEVTGYVIEKKALPIGYPNDLIRIAFFGRVMPGVFYYGI
jgi:hypothetical protein